MNILHIIPSLNAARGGPVEGVLHSVSALLYMGHQAEIATLDAPDSAWLKNNKFTVHALGPSLGLYGYNNSIVPWLKMHAHEYDAVIVNGLWQYTSFAVWRALASTATPYFIFPHGMLGPWFKHAYPLKHLKKWLYWPWAEYRVLRDARKVLFTCDAERLLARKSFWLYKVNEAVSGFGVAAPPSNSDMLISRFMVQYPHLQGKRIALFLGRIHEVKGCDLLIEAFAAVAQGDKSLHLVMAGPDQINWLPKLKAQAVSLDIAHRITWPGMLQGDMKWGAFYAAEVFCLPSHHENFGVVVAEALACGKPVLISNKVNIWREIETDGAGFVADDTLAGTLLNFERWLAMSQQAMTNMQTQTIQCFTSRFHVHRAAKQLLEIITSGNNEQC
jgi:glycosyltransferase involved in cell wall biosynthesis